MEITRYLRHPTTAEMCVVCVAPTELQAGGVSESKRSAVFTTADGKWIGTVPVPMDLQLSSLTLDEVHGLLLWAEQGE